MSTIHLGIGTYIDISVPIEYSQTFIDIIKAYPGCSLDINNCYSDSYSYHIRITCPTLNQSAIFSLIKKTAQELGMDTD